MSTHCRQLTEAKSKDPTSVPLLTAGAEQDREEEKDKV